MRGGGGKIALDGGIDDDRLRQASFLRLAADMRGATQSLDEYPIHAMAPVFSRFHPALPAGIPA